MCTAVGSGLVFIPMALGLPGERRGTERKTLNRHYVLSQRMNDRRHRTTHLSRNYAPTIYKDVDRSLALPRRRTRQTTKSRIDERPSTKDEKRKPSPFDDESAPGLPDTSTPTRRSTKQVVRTERRTSVTVAMVKGNLLDSERPTVTPDAKSCDLARARHPFTDDKWPRRFRDQLQQSIDDGISRLWRDGARGGSEAFVEDLEHKAGIEAAVYDHRVYVVHMTFLSWEATASTKHRKLAT
ncbi:hypothetical protein FOTG_17565 [Fusarium oxysporum f. sp. vasinfectum 25433]|uniref:Uncharacterized protein n=1 Tax=Fusarium oxysporum f. sp. vasinfectum 25433 TaxID=1089449 RepID=X0KYW0_FUSOX|nr:hypothetical protein FOTG_17565 [Fusarium oxysporum f. sp. vasinfectum 25433]